MNQTHTGPCVHCGAENFNIAFVEETRDRLVEKCRCFHCDFWMDKAENPHPDALIDRDYVHRMAKREIMKQRPFMGGGGTRVRFHMTDGTEFVSNDVWFQGVIPEHLRHLFKINVDRISSGYDRVA